jgi:hypothetical protein
MYFIDALDQMIVRKFTNYRTQVYLKKNSNKAGIIAPAARSGPLFKFYSILTGRQLFAKDNSTLINSMAAQRVTAIAHGNPVAVRQTVLREMWNSLSDTEKVHWDEMAEAGTGDIEKCPQSCSPHFL